jgi:hypothetical protein
MFVVDQVDRLTASLCAAHQADGQTIETMFIGEHRRRRLPL